MSEYRPYHASSHTIRSSRDRRRGARRERPTRTKIEGLHRGWFREGIPLVVELDYAPAH